MSDLHPVDLAYSPRSIDRSPISLRSRSPAHSDKSPPLIRRRTRDSGRSPISRMATNSPPPELRVADSKPTTNGRNRRSTPTGVTVQALIDHAKRQSPSRIRRSLGEPTRSRLPREAVVKAIIHSPLRSSRSTRREPSFERPSSSAGIARSSSRFSTLDSPLSPDPSSRRSQKNIDHLRNMSKPRAISRSGTDSRAQSTTRSSPSSPLRIRLQQQRISSPDKIRPMVNRSGSGRLISMTTRRSDHQEPVILERERKRKVEFERKRSSFSERDHELARHDKEKVLRYNRQSSQVSGGGGGQQDPGRGPQRNRTSSPQQARVSISPRRNGHEDSLDTRTLQNELYYLMVQLAEVMGIDTTGYMLHHVPKARDEAKKHIEDFISVLLFKAAELRNRVSVLESNVQGLNKILLESSRQADASGEEDQVETKRRISELTEAISGTAQPFEEQQQQVSWLQKGFDRVSKDAKSQKARADMLEAMLEERGVQISALRQTFAQVPAELEKQLSSASLVTLKDHVDEVEEMYADAKREVELERTRVVELEACVHEQNQAVLEMADREDGLKETIAQLESQMDVLQRAYNTLLDTSGRANFTETDLRRKLIESQDQMANLLGEVDVLKKLVMSQDRELQTAEIEQTLTRQHSEDLVRAQREIDTAVSSAKLESMERTMHELEEEREQWVAQCVELVTLIPQGVFPEHLQKEVVSLTDSLKAGNTRSYDPVLY